MLYQVNDRKEISKMIASAKQYLKGRFTTHCQIDANCSSHCISHGLKNNQNEEFCSVVHDKTCIDCINIINIFTTLKDRVNVQDDSHEKSVQLFDLQNAVNKITDWQKHVLRGTQQEKARSFAMNSLSYKRCLWIRDWGQKILPTKVTIMTNLCHLSSILFLYSIFYFNDFVRFSCNNCFSNYLHFIIILGIGSSKPILWKKRHEPVCRGVSNEL